jgi:molybdenum cofactor cytidylyltransferase
MKLHEALGIVPGDVVAFTGAGGKTSALVSIGYELANQGWRVLATTTMPLPREQLELVPHALRYDANPQTISDALSEYGFVFLYGDIRSDLVYGPDVEWTRQLLDTVDSDVLLVEADYAAGKLLKVPADGEPRIPAETSLVVPVATLGVLDQPLNEQHVYNAQAMISKYGFYAGGAIRSAWVAQVMRDEEFGLRGIPERARVVAFVNQTPEDGYLRNRGRLVARLMLKSQRIQAVAVGSVRAANPVYEVQRRVAAIVLAAGQSRRMGTAKVLLPWERGKTILEHIVEQLVRSRIDQIQVVTGHYAAEVRKLLKPLDVELVHNRAYQTGEMLSSLQVGLRSIPDSISAVLIVLGDQPRIQPAVIYQLLKAYSEGAGSIIIPSYQMRRGHPILIDRKYWQEILQLKGNQTARDVFMAHSQEITHLEVDNDSVLQDVDTPADYAQARWKAGLPEQGLIHSDPDRE